MKRKRKYKKSEPIKTAELTGKIIEKSSHEEVVISETESSGDDITEEIPPEEVVISETESSGNEITEKIPHEEVVISETESSGDEITEKIPQEEVVILETEHSGDVITEKIPQEEVVISETEHSGDVITEEIPREEVVISETENSGDEITEESHQEEFVILETEHSDDEITEESPREEVVISETESSDDEITTEQKEDTEVEIIEKEILTETVVESVEDDVKIEEKSSSSKIAKNVVTKRLSKDKLEEYLEARPDGKKRKIIIKKVQKKNIEQPVEIQSETPEEKKVTETADDKQDQEKSYIDLAADYALPTSEAGHVKQEDLVPSDWKEKKISSYIKKPEGTPVLKSFEEGKILSEHYEILDKLSEDINGVLYKVKDLREKDEKKYIKSIKEIQYISGEGVTEEIICDTVKRLERMTSFLNDVDHPNLTKIYDYFSMFEEDKSARFFIVTDYIEGNTLEELLKVYSKEGAPIAMKTAFGIMEKICDALYYLHNKKPFPVGFGDLKPSNVMMALDGSIKFINYGIGSFFDKEKDGTMASRGTIGYAAPEQRGVDFTNTKADIFALGVTVYYMLTGVDPEEHPYEFKPLRKHKRFVSENVQRFIDRCLAVHPDDRPDINAVKKLMGKMDLHELDLSSVLKKKEEEIKKQEEVTKEETPPPAISQEKVDEIVTDFKARNPLIASWYGIVSIIFLFTIIIWFISNTSSYISSLPKKGTFLYMTSVRAQTITELNLHNSNFKDFINLPVRGGPISYSKKRRRIYTFSPADNRIYEINIDTGDIVKSKKMKIGTSYILLSGDENLLYVLNSVTDRLDFIKTEDFQEERSSAQTGRSPVYASLSLSGDRLFITGERDESITVFDTKYFIVKNILTFTGDKPKGASGDKDRAYVCLSGSNRIAIVDLLSGNTVNYIPVNGDPLNVLFYSREPNRIYVITGVTGSIQVFDKDSFSPLTAQKYTGFKVLNSISPEDGKFYMLGESDYVKNSSIAIYDISLENLDVIKSKFPLSFLAFVKI
jgi:serine/threonine-protein kinase